MPGLSSCPDCPFAGRPEPCHALKVRHPGFCRPKYRSVVVRLTTGRADAPAPAPAEGATPRPPSVVVDPFRLALDLCPGRVTCSCRDPITCLVHGQVDREYCRACLGFS